MTTLIHLDWQPVILLKVVRLPFSDFGGLSLKCAYLAHDGGRLLYADWTLDAAERAEPLVFATGWEFTSMPVLPFLLQGDGAKRVPSGTWVLPYKDSLYTLYGTTSNALARLLHQIDHRPTDPNTITSLIRLTESI
ncbi:MAG: hypothetical protein IAE80_28305 [Anaerolinea sp.]|jgi:hypothetical protein|nr:hypothetical protein [Anaerolinea sp.]